MTAKAVGLGLLLAAVFGAANAYLAMRAGQTVSATIPAAVIALALFRMPWLRGTVQEQNLARTAASVGEALIAGAAFTIPAFVLSGFWKDFHSHYWEASLILLVGGLLGTFFIIVLRRPLCVDAKLPWPESVACAEIVRASERSAGAPKLILGSAVFGGLIQILKSDKGFHVLSEYAEGFWKFPASIVRHFDFDKKTIGEVAHQGGIPWTTPALSPALIGVGYIIGPKLASINVAGGVLAWWVIIPLLLFFDPDLARRLGGDAAATPDVMAYTLWYNVVRPMAVGAMLVGACYTLFNMRESLVRSVMGALRASGQAGMGASTIERTERDIPVAWTFFAAMALVVPVTAIFYYFTGSWTIAMLAAIMMSATGFLLSAAGGYLVGLVGGSNQPLSGLTLSALVVTALLLVTMGVSGAAGVGAVLGVAAVVACACSVSGSLIQDLKAGQLLEGTPWKMQVVEIVAVVMLAFFLMAPIIVLHEANLGTGGIGGRALPAPQAGLMAQLTTGIVSGGMAWGLLAIGVAFGMALVLCGARAPMLVAVGMYLPFDTSAAIFVGGCLRWITDRAAGDSESAEERGTLLASGLIAGEALMGILLAAAFVGGMPSLAMGALAPYRGWLSMLGFAALAWVLVRLPISRRNGVKDP
jgi:putative OPT family oligopeptide transporter